MFPEKRMGVAMSDQLLEAAETTALKSKQKHWAAVRKRLKERKSVQIPARPRVRNINDYPLGKFENLDRSRLEWVEPNYFQFIPKKNRPLTFVRSTKERHTKEFFH